MLFDLKNLCSKLQVSVRGFKYVLLGLLWVGSCDVFAGNACVPFSYSALNLSINPATISATPYSGVDKLLSETIALAGKASECTLSSLANLRFYTLECTNACAYDKQSGLSYFSGGGNEVNIFFISVETAATRSSIYNGVPSPNPIFKIVQQINVRCGGGLVVSIDTGNPGGYRVDGINGSSCNGAYTVTHTVRIYQTQYTPPSGTPITSIALGSDINLGIKLFDGTNPDAIIDRWGQIAGSGLVKLNFVSEKCTVTVPANIIGLGIFNTIGLSQNSGTYSSSRTANFNVRLTGCSRSSYNQVSFFWVFSDVDSLDDSILLNSNTNITSNAKNVGVQLIYLPPSGIETYVRHRSALQIDYLSLPPTSTDISYIAFKAKMVKSTNVVNSSDIRAGAFSATATLFVQYQ